MGSRTKILIILMAMGCNKLSTNPEADPLSFKGIKAAELTQSGSLVLSWDAPAVGTVKAYEVYQQDIGDLTAATGLKLNGNQSRASGLALNKVIINMPDAEAPSKKGRLIQLVTGDKAFYELKSLTPGSYSFQIRAIDARGISDTNQKVVVIKYELALQYPGLSQLRAESGKIIMEWPALETSLKGDVQYTVFQGEAFNKSIAITTATRWELSYRGERPGSKLSFGVRSTDPQGRTDNNTSLLSIIVPQDDSDFLGCIEGQARGADRIRIRFAWPDAEYETMRIFRNGIQVFLTKDKGINEFLDLGLQEGENYQYTCMASLKDLNRNGSRQLNLQTLSSNPPIFTGIRSVEIKSAQSALIRWNVSSGVPTAKFKIFANPGTQVNWEETPIAEAASDALEILVDQLGDELQYAFGVRACSQKAVCDSNEISLTGLTPDDGAPKTQGATSLAVADRILRVNASWQPYQGGIARRLLYVKEDGAASTDLADYRLKNTLVVTNPAQPSQILSYQPISDNTIYHVIVRDQDALGQMDPFPRPLTLTTGDTSPPVFSGISSLAKGAEGQEQYSLTAVFLAITPETLSKYGASVYQIFLLRGTGNACKNGTFHSTTQASNYTAGEEVRLEIKDLEPLTFYSVCVKAADSAGNSSETEVSLSRSTLDTTPPPFDGLQGISYDRLKAELVLEWNPSSATDLYEYQIRVWKSDPNPANVPNTLIKKRKNEATQGIRLNNGTIALASQELVYAMVTACDNASFVDGGKQNCSSEELSLSKSVQLDDVDAPRNFIGIKSEPELITPKQGSVLIRWVTPSDWIDYRGFKVYLVNPETFAIDEPIKNCACSAAACPNRLSECLIENLDPFRTYIFHVRAYDAVGNLTLLDPQGTSTAKRTSDEEAPDFNSALALVYEGGKSSLSWSTATDNQYLGEPGAVISYEVWRRKNANFSDTRKPFDDENLGATKLVTLTERQWVDQGEDYQDGDVYYYTVCALDGANNRSCDGTVKSLAIPDLTPPTIGSLSSNQTYDAPDWTLTWTMADNKNTVEDLLVQLYEKQSVDPNYVFSPADTKIVNGRGILQKAALKGPININTYMHYLLVVQDLDGNKVSKTLRIRSENKIDLKTVRSSEGTVAGNNLLVIIGDGFKNGVEVKIAGNDCIGLVAYSKKHLTCRAPANVVGSYDVLVRNTDGSSKTLIEAYRYCDPNVVDSCQNICNQLDSNWGSKFASGDGNSSSSPYMICNASHLASIKTIGYNKFYKLGQNVDLNNVSLSPITNSGTFDFRGDFDGDNYAILNWSYENLSLNLTGLFRVINLSTVRDFGLINFQVRGANYVGALAGASAIDSAVREYYSTQNSISGIYVTGNIESTDQQVGGIIGRAVHNASNLTSFATVRGRRLVGGIFGVKVYGGNNFANYGSVVATGNSTNCQVGGIAGSYDTQGYSMNQVESAGTVDCTDEAGVNPYYTGGAFGQLYNNNTSTLPLITNIVSSARVNGKSRVGGISGFLRSVILQNVSSTAQVKGTNFGGGIAGEVYGATLMNCKASGSVELTSNLAGGLVGAAFAYNSLPPKILDCTSEGKVQANTQVGGALGYGESVEIRNTEARNTVSGSGLLGGLVGEMAYATIDKSAAFNSIEAPTADHVGGLVGRGRIDGNGSTITDSMASGQIVGRNSIGGLAGSFGGIIRKSSAIGRVLGQTDVGGLIGYLHDGDATGFNTIEQSSASGAVTATTRGGGLIGQARSYSKITQAYASGDITAPTRAGGLIGELVGSFSTIDLSYATGNVLGNSAAGGFLGACYCNNASGDLITDSYASGSVVGNNYVGGFAGQTGDIMRRVFSTGKVSYETSPTAVGGLVGAFWNADGPGNVPDGFWDADRSGQLVSAGGVSKSTNEMFGSAIYENYDGSLWNFSSRSYPSFKWTSPE